MSARSVAATAVLLAAACALDLALPRVDAERRLAEEVLGECERVDVEGLAAYRSGDRALLFFEGRGTQGPIRGTIELEGERIREVRLHVAREGVDRTALQRANAAGSFGGRIAAPPVAIPAVTGATVSTQALVDAVNRRLKEWRELRR